MPALAPNREDEREKPTEKAKSNAELLEWIPYIKNVIVSKFDSDGDREEVLSMVLLSCVASFPKFNGNSSLKTWIHTITIRRIADHIRGRYRGVYPYEYTSMCEVYTKKTPESEFIRKEAREKVMSGFFVLSVKEKEVFLYMLEDLNFTEIAPLMGISNRTVSSYYVSGLKKLKRLYGVKNGGRNGKL